MRVVAVVAVLSFPASSAAGTTVFKAQFVCNDRGVVYPLAGVRVEFRKRAPWPLPKLLDKVAYATHADGEGRVELTVRGDESDFYFRVLLDDGAGVRAEDWWSPWAWSADTATNQNDVPMHDYRAQQIGDGRIPPECAAFEGARRAYHAYRDQIGERPPYGDLKINVNSPSAGVPLSPFVRMQWPPRYPPGRAPGGFETTTHEFAHTVRHKFDGNLVHFLFDASPDRFNYLQYHEPCQRTNAGFAFNEGWAEYWAGDFAPAPNCPGIAATDFSVEGNVAAALDALERRCPGVDRPRMVDVLRRNRGGIHSLDDFRRALGCTLFDGLAKGLPPSEAVLSRSQMVRFGKQQVQAVERAIARLKRQMRVAKRGAEQPARPDPCRPKPCLRALSRAILPSLIQAQLGQVRLLRRTLSVQASRRGLRSLGVPGSGGFQRRLASRAQGFRLGSAKVGKQALQQALRAARPILRRDRSPAVTTIARSLRAALRTFRRGRLPAGFAIPTPAAARLVTGTPLPPAPRPPAPTPPPPPPPAPAPPPPPGPKPDLVVDTVTLNLNAMEWNIEVRNAGNTDADASKTGITQPPDQPEVLIDTPALAAGASVTVKATCPYGSQAEGTARADATNVVDESSEANNDRAFGPTGTNGRCRFP